MAVRNYVVHLYGKVAVDTTVAVRAETEKEAERIALRGVDGDTSLWLHTEGLLEEPGRSPR